MISNEVLLALIGVITLLAGAWAYGYRKEQDRKTLELQRQIDDRKRDDEVNQNTLQLLNRVMTRWEQEALEAKEERKAWVQVVERNEAAKSRLADNVEKNTEATAENSSKVDAMQAQFDQFRDAVGGQFEAFKQQLESRLSEEGLGPVLDVIFERFVSRMQSVVVHAPALAQPMDDEDTLQLPSLVEKAGLEGAGETEEKADDAN